MFNGLEKVNEKVNQTNTKLDRIRQSTSQSRSSVSRTKS